MSFATDQSSSKQHNQKQKVLKMTSARATSLAAFLAIIASASLSDAFAPSPLSRTVPRQVQLSAQNSDNVDAIADGLRKASGGAAAFLTGLGFMAQVAFADQNAIASFDSPNVQPEEVSSTVSSDILLSAGAPSFGGGSFETMDFSMPSYGDAVGGAKEADAAPKKDLSNVFANPFGGSSDSEESSAAVEGKAAAKEDAAAAKADAAAAKADAAADAAAAKAETKAAKEDAKRAAAEEKAAKEQADTDAKAAKDAAKEERKAAEKEKQRLAVESQKENAEEKKAIEASDAPAPAPAAPSFDLPEVKMPNIPSFSIPKMEMPKVDSPSASAPAVEFKAPEMPDIKVPDIKIPDFKSFSMPKIDIPKIDAPKFDIPAAPKFDLPATPKYEFDMPKVDTPKFDIPKVATPSFDLPSRPAAAPVYVDPNIEPQEIRDARAADKKDAFKEAQGQAKEAEKVAKAAQDRANDAKKAFKQARGEACSTRPGGKLLCLRGFGAGY